MSENISMVNFAEYGTFKGEMQQERLYAGLKDNLKSSDWKVILCTFRDFKVPFIFPNTRLLVLQTLQPARIVKDFTTLNTITDVRPWCNKRAVVQKLQRLTQING